MDFILSKKSNQKETSNMPLFTRREEELQKLLAEERKRSEQRRNNYNSLKGEHLKLQDQYLNLQAEMKQILEETVYFKEKKKEELEELLKINETKSKQIEKLEKNIRENDPEILRIKLIDELDEPLKKAEKEKDKLNKDRERLCNELKLYKQQIEHMEKEHLDAIEKIKLSYEVELNLIKREKEEIRIRLVEASQVPDVKKLIDLSEENSRLNRRLQSAQDIIEQVEQKYKQIQQQIQDLVLENEQKEKIHESKIAHLQEQINEYKQEIKNLKIELNVRNSEIEEHLKEIGHLKRMLEKYKFDIEQQRILFDGEKETIVSKMNNEIKLLNQTKDSFKEEIKKQKELLARKDESIAELEKIIESKDKECAEKISSSINEELEKLTRLEHEKKSLELSLEDCLNEKRTFSLEMEKQRRHIEQLNEIKNGQERETMLLRAKLETQASAIEELEKIRKQHIALHEEVNRLKLESYDNVVNNKELTRMNQNMKEEIVRLKEQLEEERRHLEEVNISNEKQISKISNRFDEERNELRERINRLEKENYRLRTTIPATKPQDVYRIKASDYSRLKARQYAKIADRLNSLLEHLQVNNDPKENNVDIKSSCQNNHTSSHDPKKNDPEQVAGSSSNSTKPKS
ncbi:establishment of centrosome localization [Dermatophagoides pteronyssinus]|uniref:Establishment of centrosome localization n=1 Tax=Dermatophagoides pteronyssinus TaxID=6956 RepID=A0ABQ8IWV7_DERPT|nr:establishment of centrosome localization [Dermatophagoides pteronyssinus]